jgi:FkbM family methyltransferase
LFEFLEKDTYLFKFAIGDKDEAAALTVPKDNYGGAFILNDKNSYSQKELASKDGFHQFDRANYDDLRVEVRRGRDVLGPIFAECQDGLVIKIDAEGFESTILKEIAAALPARLRYAIIFENWSQHFDPDGFVRQFLDATPKVMKLHSTVNPRAGKLMKVLKLILHSRRDSLTPKPSEWVGTLICTHPDVDIS